MSKFADYYTYSPLAAMRTGRQPPCPVSRRHDTLPAPNALSAGGMTRCPAPNALSAEGMRRCPVPQCPVSRRHETLPSTQGRHKERRGARHKGK